MKQLLLLLSLVLLGETGAVANDAFKLSRTTPLKSRSLNISFSQSTVCSPFSDRVVITGLSITGRIEKTSPEYLVRVILKDTTGKEYLVMESYEELNSNTIIDFENYCEETDLLDNIVPDSLKVYIKDATLHVSNFHTTTISERGNVPLSELRKQRRLHQISTIVERINSYNRVNRRLWIAEETPLSQQSYEIRRMILGLPDNVPSGGLEYYAGGVFAFGHSAPQRVVSSSPYPKNVDWRLRYGRNWMTSVKHQGFSQFCTVFGAIGTLEAMVNLYYNQNLNLNLSEQEIASCADETPHTLVQPFNFITVANYIIGHGVCDEQSFPFDPLASNGVECISDEINPIDVISVNRYQYVSENEGSIKNALITKGPIYSGYTKPGNSGHAMVLAGYKTFEIGDIIWRYNRQTGQPQVIDILTNTDSLYIGRTCWLFKNSYGTEQLFMDEGYQWILFYDEDFPVGMIPPCYFEYPVYSNIYTEADRIWEDKDGDGSFFWGIGLKPASCPSWVPNEEDGDDNDPELGPMNEYGIPQPFGGNNHGWNISHSEVFANDTIFPCNLIMSDNVTLTIKGYLNLYGNSILRMGRNSELIVDGGCLYNAEFFYSAGGRITIRNNGSIVMRKNKEFDIPIGLELNIESGEIK